MTIPTPAVDQPLDPFDALRRFEEGLLAAATGCRRRATGPRRAPLVLGPAVANHDGAHPRGLLEQEGEERAAGEIVVMADPVRGLRRAGQQHDRGGSGSPPVGTRPGAFPIASAGESMGSRGARGSRPALTPAGARSAARECGATNARDRSSPPRAGRTSDRDCAARTPRRAVPDR